MKDTNIIALVLIISSMLMAFLGVDFWGVPLLLGAVMVDGESEKTKS